MGTDGDQTGGLAGQVLAPGGRDEVRVLVVSDTGDDGVPPSTALSPEVRVVGVKARRSGWLGRAPGCSHTREPQARGPVGVGGGPGARVAEHRRGGDGNNSAGDDVGAAVLPHGVLVVTGEVPAGALMVRDLPWLPARLLLAVYFYQV